MRRLRWWLSRSRQRTYAREHGYFWIPCPCCGVSFGGHEWRTLHEIPKDDGTGQNQGICPPCAYAIGSAFKGICRASGHEYLETWKGQIQVVEHEANRTTISGAFQFDMPPSEVICERCFMEFDSLTRLPIGYPLW